MRKGGSVLSNDIDPITASAIGRERRRDFRNGRQMAARTGLVPKQSSSRRQGSARQDHQARRHASARTADTRRALGVEWPPSHERPLSPRTESTGSSRCANASATTRASWPSLTSTPASVGRCSRARQVTIRRPTSRARRLEGTDPCQATRYAAPPRQANEVRASTVKTRLTTRRDRREWTAHPRGQCT